MKPTVIVEPISYMTTSGCKFYTSFKSTDTFICEVSHNNPFEMFCHENQTDQLIPIHGTMYLFYIHEMDVKYVTLCAESPVCIIIPPTVIHGSINVSGKSAAVVNALVRHHEPAPNDYVPITRLEPGLEEKYLRLYERLKTKHGV